MGADTHRIAAAAMLALSGCYETQIPIVTQQNAHASPLIPDGRYCEMTFENTRPVTGIGQCITLTWEDGANGWRTDNLSPGDEHGVSIRARKLGHGNDAVGRSGFFMVQAGPQPRQAAIGAHGSSRHGPPDGGAETRTCSPLSTDIFRKLPSSSARTSAVSALRRERAG